MRRAVLLALFAALLLAGPAHAAFPGANGKIAFVSTRDGNPEIYTMNADGSEVTRLTNDSQADCWPKWSPDGKKIVFESNRGTSGLSFCPISPSGLQFDLYVMNADGTGVTRLTTGGFDKSTPTWNPDKSDIAYRESSNGNNTVYVVTPDGTFRTALFSPTGYGLSYPAWAPDGTKFAITASQDGLFEIATVKTDGSGFSPLSDTQSDDSFAPNWSADGSKIVYETANAVWVINEDGTGNHAVMEPNASGDFPAWSPDGTKIVFAKTLGNPTDSTTDVYTINPDGTGLTRLTNNSFVDIQPDWQPLIPTGPGYARPKGATPFQTYLTVAYKQCTAPNEQHGAPLAILSCNPPQQASNFLTVGTLDANGQQAKAVGVYRLDVKNSPADVKITFALKDVRNKLDLTDYTGELRVTENWRLTDKNNGPTGGGGGSDPATNQDIPFVPLDVTCAGTPSDSTVGSTCDAITSANAVVPGSIQGGTRMNSELGQVQVQDGGSDGVAATTTDNTLFMDQGIFIP